MAIPAGLLDQRVTIRTPNPLANPTTDKFGNLIAAPGKLLYQDTKRWALVTSISASEKNTDSAYLPDGSLNVVVRRDSYTRRVTIGDKIQWEGSWYAITDESVNIRTQTITFFTTPSDSNPRGEFSVGFTSIDSEDGIPLFTVSDEIIEPEERI